MKKVLVTFLSWYKKWRLFILKLKGKTEEDVHLNHLKTGKAWEDYCDTLKAAGSSILYGNPPQDTLSQAEAYRYLSRLTRAGLDAFVEFSDPQFPILKRMVHETVKLGADNPDNHYANAQLSGDYEYVIKGERNSIFYLGFFTQNGSYGTTGGLSPCGALQAEDMQFEVDGSFEIHLSKTKKGKNWLKIEAETSLLIVRQTYMDRAVEVKAEMHIETVAGPAHPRALSAEAISTGLDMAGTFVAGASMIFARWAKGFQQHTNRLPQMDPAKSIAAGGDINIAYYHSYWKLEKDEVLVIDVMPPECRHWNFQLNNHWMESLDYRYFNIHVNKHSANYKEDGSVQVVVAHENHDFKNWINTVGHTQGTMLWRWWSANEFPEPQCRLMKLNDFLTEKQNHVG
jgi:hypothetical protein